MNRRAERRALGRKNGKENVATGSPFNASQLIRRRLGRKGEMTFFAPSKAFLDPLFQNDCAFSD